MTHTMSDNHLLLKEAACGNTEQVKHLLTLSDSQFYDYHEALCLAAEYGNVDCVQILLPLTNSFDDALQWAAMGGHTQCVEVLLSHCDPTFNNSGALRMAVYHHHKDIFKILYQVSDVQAAVSNIINNPVTKKSDILFMKECIAECENKIIHENISFNSSTVCRTKKI